MGYKRCELWGRVFLREAILGETVPLLLIYL